MKIPEQIKAKIRKLREKGHTLDEIAEKVKVSPGTVRYIIDPKAAAERQRRWRVKHKEKAAEINIRALKKYAKAHPEKIQQWRRNRYTKLKKNPARYEAFLKKNRENYHARKKLKI